MPLHSVLGNIDASAPGYWHGTLSFAERSVALGLSIDRDPVSEEAITRLLARVDELAAIDAQARRALSEDANANNDEAPTVLYLEHHRDELSDEDLKKVFGSSDRDLIDMDALLSHLQLVRVGLYPESDEHQLVLDYSLGGDVTNYVLTAAFDAEGKLQSLDVES